MGKNKINAILTKYFKNNKTDLKEENDLLSFTLYIERFGYALYPYIRINEDELSLVIRIKEAKLDNELLKKMSDINNKSKYLACKYINESIILEYNTIVTADNVIDVIDMLIKNIFSLSEDITLL